MFGTLPHITLIRHLFKSLDNILKILHTDISHFIPFLFDSIWQSNGLENQRDNQPLSWSSLIILFFWRCYFCHVQATKFQIYVQGDVFITTFNLHVFPNISTTTMFHVHSFELTRCELFLPKRLLIVATMINRQWCYNC